jgi:hypothetical protein
MRFKYNRMVTGEKVIQIKKITWNMISLSLASWGLKPQTIGPFWSKEVKYA